MEAFDFLQNQFYKALSQRQDGERNEDVFNRMAKEFEQVHGFRCPYSNYKSFKVKISKSRNTRYKFGHETK